MGGKKWQENENYFDNEIVSSHKFHRSTITHDFYECDKVWLMQLALETLNKMGMILNARSKAEIGLNYCL